MRRSSLIITRTTYREGGNRWKKAHIARSRAREREEVLRSEGCEWAGERHSA